uniref:Uncharacterized protein n=1 Tax=Arthrobotrys musiformis TaxID=47236 RepID=A0A482EA63_9PEZI|nr:hypothetical protein [Arthrobotrys musiformis]QBM31537.1 hypothetical protein [Arthrobotrys musiformis]QBM31688.1 hypothetical protein [Arthrobotrys musiformis]
MNNKFQNDSFNSVSPNKKSINNNIISNDISDNNIDDKIIDNLNSDSSETQKKSSIDNIISEDNFSNINNNNPNFPSFPFNNKGIYQIANFLYQIDDEFFKQLATLNTFNTHVINFRYDRSLKPHLLIGPFHNDNSIYAMFSFNLTTLLDQNKKNNKHMYASIYNSTRIVPIDIKNMIGWLIRTETYILNIIYVDTISPLSDNFKNPHIIKKNFGIDEFSHPFSLTTAVYHIDNLFSLNDPNTLFFLKNLRNTLFIFNSGGFNSWKEISNKINKNSGLTVRGGSKNIRSLISPLQFRLCQTLLTMNIKVNDIISGFYTDEDNRFNSLDKKLFNNPKRSYHTISNNFKPYNKSFPLNSYNRSWFYNQNSKKY